MDYLSSLLLLCSHVASNFSSYGSSFLFPWPASHGYAVAICSNFLLGLCCHLQVASYLIFHHVIANCCYLSVCAAVLPCSSFAYACCCHLLLPWVLFLQYIQSTCVMCPSISAASSPCLILKCVLCCSKSCHIALVSIQVQLYISSSSMPCVSISLSNQPISCFYFG